jgi:hypothetical protein
LSTTFFTSNFLIAIAASPPEEVTLPAISAAVVMHTGHMDFSSLAGRRSQYAVVRQPRLAANVFVHRDPAFVHPALCLYSSWRGHLTPVSLRCVPFSIDVLVGGPETI